MWSLACPIGIGSPCAIARPDPHRQFEFVIEIAARAVTSARPRSAACAGRSVGAPGCPIRAPTRRGCDRRPARICNSAISGLFGSRRRPPFAAWWMPAKKSVKLPIAAGRCSQQSAARCSSRSASGSALARPAPSAASSAKTCCRNARRGSGPSAISGFSVPPEAASAAPLRLAREQPGARARRAGRRSCRRSRRRRAGFRRARPPRGLNTPNGRFCSGNSGWPLAESTQLRRARSWVSSIMPNPPVLAANCRRHCPSRSAACTQDLPAAGGQRTPKIAGGERHAR